MHPIKKLFNKQKFQTNKEIERKLHKSSMNRIEECEMIIRGNKIKT